MEGDEIILYVVDKGWIGRQQASSQGWEGGGEFGGRGRKKGKDLSPAPKTPQRASLQASVIIIFLSTENV